MTTRIKICGVTLADDAARVAAAGVDYLGLNFWPSSKRYLDPARAPQVVAAARGAGAALLVGVFVDAELDGLVTLALALALDVVQLHGDEDPAMVQRVADAVRRPVWKAVAAGAPGALDQLARWPVEAILLDTPTPERGGSGRTFDWSLAAELRRRDPGQQLVLAGGLDAGNVGAAITAVSPWAVDVASGVEAAPGVKDPVKLAAFVAAVRDHSR